MPTTVSVELGAAVRRLRDEVSLRCLFADDSSATAHGFFVNDSTSYLMSRVDEFAKVDYEPSIDDILHVRKKTTGVKEIAYDFKSYRFRLVDVGGQRAERRKWLHCFDDVSAVLFFVALNEYDVVLEESSSRCVEVWRCGAGEGE
jgi:hypothetical protein